MFNTESGSVIAKAELLPEVLEAAEAAAPEDLSILKGMKVNKAGKIVDEKGDPYGVLVEGDSKKLVGKKVDAKGLIWDDSGNTIGRAGKQKQHATLSSTVSQANVKQNCSLKKSEVPQRNLLHSMTSQMQSSMIREK